MSTIHKRVIEKVESLREYLFSTTRELVRIPSVNHPPTGDEYECQMAVARHLREIGLKPEIYVPDEVAGILSHPEFWPGHDYSQRPNVAARRKGSGGGKSLVFSGHIDTVPLGMKSWKHDPFGGEIVEGRLYGLGAFDMKGGVVTILGVMRALQELDIQLKGDILAETVVDEEFGGANGTLAGRLRGDNGEGMVITEPSQLQIYNGVRGGQVADVTLVGPEGIIFTEGEPGHTVRMLGHFLKWVDIFRQRRRLKVPGWAPGPEDPIPVMVTKVSAGGWGMNTPITVPAEVKIQLYWQLMPGEEKEAVRSEFFAWLDEMVADKPNDFSSRPNVEFPLRFMPASEIPVESPFIRTLSACAEQVTHQRPPISPLPAPSDMYLVQREFGIQCVHYGPSGAGAHAADEYVVLEDIVTATKTLALLALDWCGID
jgi:acetylornithine deacetylase